MSYTPNVWANGDVVTSEKLNAMEQGIAAASGGGWLKVTMTEDSGTGVTTLDKTAGEIYAAFPYVAAVYGAEGEYLAYRLESQFSDGDSYEFSFQQGDNSPWVFYAAAADDYPTDEEPGGGAE